MITLIAFIVFLSVLRTTGRVGPLVWDPVHDRGPRRWRRCAHAEGPAPADDSDGPETLLARRLADGDITPEEYLERLSLLRER